ASAAGVSVTLVPGTDQDGDMPALGSAIVIGMLLGAAASVVLGLPTMRLRGVFLAIATLAFAEAVRILIVNSESLGGAGGLAVPRVAPPAIAWAARDGA